MAGRGTRLAGLPDLRGNRFWLDMLARHQPYSSDSVPDSRARFKGPLSCSFSDFHQDHADASKHPDLEQEQSVSKPTKPIGGAIQLFKLDLQAHPTEMYPAAVKGLKLLQRNAVMTQMWEDASDDVKEKFNIAWCSKLQQYKADLSAYEEAIKDMAKESEKDILALPPKPKKPVGGAKQLFKVSVREHPTDEFTARTQGLSAPQCNPVLAEMWEQAPIEVKQRFEASFQAKLAAYHADKSAYDAVVARYAGRRVQVPALPDVPPKPVGGGFMVFLQQRRNDPEFLAETPKSTKFQAKWASSLWKRLSEEARKPFEEDFKNRLTAYNAARAAYDSVQIKRKQAVAHLPPKKRRLILEAAQPKKQPRKDKP